jgi:hypothetical protein
MVRCVARIWRCAVVLLLVIKFVRVHFEASPGVFVQKILNRKLPNSPNFATDVSVPDVLVGTNFYRTDL